MNIGVGGIFLVIFLFVLVQPWLRQKFREKGRLGLIQRIEKQNKSRVILLVHRQETMNVLGFPLFRYIDINDAEEVIRAIHLTDEEVPIEFVVHTPGGLVLPSIQIARAIKAHKAKVTVYVPHHAMSGGTLLALAADEIAMDAHAVLGPVDPMLNEYPAASLLKVVRQKDINELDDKTLILADTAEKALRQMQAEVRELLEDRLPTEQADKLAETLTQGAWTHDHPISLQEAKGLGLNIREGMPREIYDLMDLFPQPMKRYPTVQYIPLPHEPEEKR